MEHRFIRIVCANCGQIYDVPVYCGDRFCSVCGVARRFRIRSRLNFLTKQIKRPPGYNFKHLTLTIKNQQDLSLMTASIVKSFRKLRQTRSWKLHVRGGAFVIEITGKPLDWHVHLHIVIESLWYDWDTLLRLWMKLSTGRGVYIKDLPRSRIVGYLTKYLSKSEVDPEHRDAVNDALKGTRLFQPFGSWYSINRTYVKPPMQCSNCPNPCFILYQDIFSNVGGYFYKDV